MDSYKGFGLFNDVEDKSLQAYNRARMLVNIFLDYSKKGKVNTKGVALSTGYLGAIPKGERKDVLTSYISQLAKEGFELGGSEAKQSSAMEAAVNV